MNVHLPPPLGPNGAGSDETIVRNVRATAGLSPRVDCSTTSTSTSLRSSSSRASSRSTAASCPTTSNDKPPWQATGRLTVFGKNSTEPRQRAKLPGQRRTRVRGGRQPLQRRRRARRAWSTAPQPARTDPITAIANPAFEILPATGDRPLDMFGCLSLHDYPAHDSSRSRVALASSAAAPAACRFRRATIPLCPNRRRRELRVDRPELAAGPGRPGRRSAWLRRAREWRPRSRPEGIPGRERIPRVPQQGLVHGRGQGPHRSGLHQGPPDRRRGRLRPLPHLP